MGGRDVANIRFSQICQVAFGACRWLIASERSEGSQFVGF